MGATATNVEVSETEHDALDFLVQNAQTKRTALAEQLGISPQGAKDLVRRLKEDHGLPIVETDQPTGRGGQPAKVYKLDVPDGAFAVALDIGFHYVRIAACRPNGQLFGTTRDLRGHGLTSSHSPAETFDAAADAIREVLSDRSSGDLVGVGVAVAGPMNPDEGMLRSTSDPGPWEAVDFAKEIRERLPMYEDLQIEVDNDAALGAIAEHRTGAAVGFDHVVYVRWTAGIGAGLIFNGQPYAGARGIAGELGHFLISTEQDAGQADAHTTARAIGAEAADHKPPVCQYCKKRCFQAVAGTDAIIADADARGARLGVPIDTATIRHVIEVAESDDAAKSAIHQAAGHVGRMLAIVVDLLNPEIVVLGGAFGRDQYRLVVPAIQESMHESTIQPSYRDARIVMAVHSAAHLGGAVIQGAATRVFDKHLANWLLARPVDG